MSNPSPNSGAGNNNEPPKDEKSLLRYWKEEIRAGVRYRTLYGKAKDWQVYKNMYRGFWGKGVVPVNIIYAIGRSLVPQIYFRNPKVSIEAKMPGFTAHAMVLERIDNYLIKETQLKYQMKSNALDAYLCGVGPMVLGYDSEYGFNPSFTTDSAYKDSGLTSFSKDGERIEYTDSIRPGMPWALRCNPEDFIVPWGTNKWQESRWFAFRKMRTKEDIIEDPKYKNTTGMSYAYYTKLEGSTEGSSGERPRINEIDDGNRWAELWEVHDKRTGRVFSLSLDHNQFLRDEFDEMQIEGLPAEVVGFNEDPDYFWWTPDCRLIQTQQTEINDIRTMAKKHRRVGLLKMIVDKNLDKNELEKLIDEDPKVFARIDLGPQGDIRKVVSMLESHVPPDLITYAREVREDVREIVGFSRNQMGSFEESSGRRTAHEAEIVRAASLIRIDERRDIMADHLENIIRGYNRIIFENWTQERVVDIIGNDGARYWVRFNGDDIKGEFHYKINPEETIPQDTRTRRSEAENFIALAQKIPGVNMQYLMQQYARQFDWLDPSQLLPQANGAGRSPEKAMTFPEFSAKQGQGTSGFPGLQSGQGVGA